MQYALVTADDDKRSPFPLAQPAEQDVHHAPITHPKGQSHALVAPGEGELIEVAGNRIMIIAARASQMVCDDTAAPRFSLDLLARRL